MYITNGKKNSITKKCKRGLWKVRLNITKVSILPKLTFNLLHFKSKPKLDLEPYNYPNLHL